jgi:uncharacterized membrane protein
MPEIGSFHPQIVHFVIALGIIGVLFRLVSLTGRLAWTGPSATVLLLLAAGASVAAAESGDQVHGLAERVPGAREAVEEHQEAGEWARDFLLGVAALEIGALVMRGRPGVARWLTIGSGVVGLVTLGTIYEAGEHGGHLVYGYAGGVGTRSGDPADVQHLLVAGLFHEARVARDSGRSAEAARLTEELARQMPDDPTAKLLVAESMLRDNHDPRGAMAALAAIPAPPDQWGFVIRKGLILSDAYLAAGLADSAKAVLTDLAQRFPKARGVEEALKKLK